MIELFSRPPYNVELSFAANVVPIHVDDSSAIRLPMHLGVSGVFLIFCLIEYIIFATEPRGE